MAEKKKNKDAWEYRDMLITHIEYIREKVDSNNDELNILMEE